MKRSRLSFLPLMLSVFGPGLVVMFADTDAGAAADEIHAGVFPNGSSNDFVTIVTPGAGTRIKLVCDGTNWIISGIVFSATVPAFADT